MIEEAENGIVSAETRIVSRLASLPLAFAFPLCVLPFLLFWLTQAYWNQYSYISLLHWDVTKNAADLLVILVLLAPLSLVTNLRYKTPFYFGIAAVGWTLHCWWRGGVFTANPITWPAAYSVPALLGLTWFLTLRKNWSAHVRVPALLAVTAGLALLNGFASAAMHDPVYIRLFWGAHIEVFVLVAMMRFVWKRDTSQSDLDLTLNPMNLISGVFWPIDLQNDSTGKSVAERRVWWSGYYSLITGCVLQLVSMMMFADRHLVLGFSTFLGLQWIGLAVFAGLTALARMTVGVARLYGCDVPDASNFVFFSRSPVDSLRRGYVYAYEFNLRYICLPVFRWTKSLAFSVICAFSFYVFIRFLFQPYFVPMAYNALFPGFSLYIPHYETYLDLVRSGVLLSAFLLEPIFNKVRSDLGLRTGTIVCILLSYLTLSGMRQVEPFLSLIFRFLRDNL